MIAVGDLVSGKVIGKVVSGQQPEVIIGRVINIYVRTVSVNSGGKNYLIKIEDLSAY